ncbi:MAG: SGNH/GDSL hydrolase family protein [Acidimicrobiales bacterium]
MRRSHLLLLVAAALVGLATAPAAAQLPLPPPERPAEGITYVALGDSFTSGPLVPNQVGTPIDCARSDQNYAQLAAAELGVAELRDVSCSGATIDDFAAPQGPLPLGGVNPPQFDALDEDVDVVTVGIGGNDVGFVSLATGCLRFVPPPLSAPCSPPYTAGGVDQISERIAAVGPELGAALREVQLRAPNAEVLVVGYPTSLPDDAVACYPYVPILAEDMGYLVAKFKEMNAMLAEQAATNGATYVDIYTSSIGHDVCQLPGEAWVNAIVLVPPSLIAHPNALSFQNSAPVVAAAIREQLAGPSGPSGPSGAASVVEPPAESATVRSASAGAARPTDVLARTGGGAATAAAAGLALLSLLFFVASTTVRGVRTTKNGQGR